ncbi:BspA family leucine-rich repeat surface protein, partial [Enterococcus faecalis]|uniref:BspA family leucine-rich repeat surface protein n=1 Tax=Enterococcus faecalis TaxID=1351 RepID=UPI0035E82C4D
MSKKKLTKTKKKQLLSLFATTSMTVNVVMAPLSVLAERNEEPNMNSAVNVLEKNMDLPEVTMNSNNNSEDEPSDIEGTVEGVEKTAESSTVEEGVEKTAESSTVEEGAEKTTESSTIEEVTDKQESENETKEGTLTGSYENDGIWTFDQENGVLVLSGGTLNGGTINTAIQNSTWLRKIAKNDILEIHISNVVGGKDLSSLFVSYTKVRKITFDNFDTSQTTLMRSMFNACTNLTEIDLSTFDTSKVTGMSSMFYGCAKLTELDLSGFHTEKLQNTQFMFQGCTNLKNLNLSNFDTSLVTNMSQMFASCNKIENLILGSQTKLKGTSTTSLRTLSSTEFWYDSSSKKILDSTNDFITYHNRSNETKNYILCTYKYENGGIWSFKNGILTLTGGNLSNSTKWNSWLIYLDKNDITEINVKDATGEENLESLFSTYPYVERITFDNFDTSKVTNMYRMFSDCSNLKELDLRNFDTSNVTEMSKMFYGASSLESLDVSNFDTSKVTNMNGMFQGCNGLAELDLSSFDTSQVRNMMNMFENCSSLKELNLSNFNTSVATEGVSANGGGMIEMFKGCTNLVKLDLSGFKTKVDYFPILTIGDLFKDCTNLTELILGEGMKLSEEMNFKTLSDSEVWKSALDSSVLSTSDELIAYHNELGKTNTYTLVTKEEKVVFETDDYHIGDYNITGRFSAPIVTAQLRINGSISNKGGTFNKNDGTFYYYAGAGRIQMGQEVVLEGLNEAGNIVETVKINPQVTEGNMTDVVYTLGTSYVTGNYTGEMSKARLVVNGTIISIGGTFKDGTFNYYVNSKQLKETDTIQ